MAPLLNSTVFDSSNADSSDSDSSINTKTQASGKLPKLVDNGTTNNYGEWRIQSQSELRSLDLWKYIEGPHSIPPDIPNLEDDLYLDGSDDEGNTKRFHITGNTQYRNQKIRAAKPWMMKNEIARNKIVRSLSTAQLHFVDGVIYASEAWNILHDHYQPLNSSLAISLRSDIQGYRCVPPMDIHEWLIDMQKMYHDLLDMSPDSLSDREFALVVINNLPQSGGRWETFTSNLRERINKYDNTKPTPLPVRSVEFLSAIRQEYLLCNRNKPEVTAQIFSARVNAENRTGKRPLSLLADNPASASSSKRPRSNKTCTNSECGRTGHEITDCITYGRGNVGNYPNWWRGPFNIHLPPKSRTRANNVPPASHPFARTKSQSTSTPAAQANLTITPDSTMADAFPASDNKTESPDIILASCVDEDDVITTLPVFDVQQPRNDLCFFDSGANRHVFNDQSFFESYQPISPINVHGVGTDCLTKAIGRGNVRLQTSHASKTSSIVLADVLHIPRARSNLISGGQFDERGVHTRLGDGKSSFFYRGVPFLDGFLKNRFYHLNIKVVRPTTLPLSARISPSSTEPTLAVADALQPDFCTASWGT
jgi:hypothetical protein